MIHALTEHAFTALIGLMIGALVAMAMRISEGTVPL